MQQKKSSIFFQSNEKMSQLVNENETELMYIVCDTACGAYSNTKC